MKIKILFLLFILFSVTACNKTNSTSENYDFEGTYKMASKEGWIKNNYCYIKKGKENTYTITYHKDLDIEPEIVKRKGDTLLRKTGEYSSWLYILNSDKDTIDVKNNYDNTDVNKFSHSTYYIKQ